MGNTISDTFIQYAVPVGPSPYEDSTPIYRSAVHPANLVRDLQGEKWDSPWDIFQFRLKDRKYRELEFIGSRLWDADRLESRDGPPGPLKWLTYGQAERMAIALAKGLINAEVVKTAHFPEEKYAKARQLRSLGIMSKNRPEWFIFEQATSAGSLTLVPLYDSLGDAALMYILDLTRMNIMALSLESAGMLLQLLTKHKADDCPAELKNFQHNLDYLICFDKPTEAVSAKASELGITITYWKKFTETSPERDATFLCAQEYEDVGTICFTSGTTGSPKGVMITAGNYASIVAAHQRCIMTHPGFRTGHSDVHISYLPLAHVFERLICANCIALGIKIACYSGDTLKLLDDMKIIRPTIFLSVPRLYMRINDKIFAGIQDKSTVAQFLFNTAVSAKLKNLREKGIYTHPLWDPLVFNGIRKLMGGCVKFMLVGGAPLESIVQERMSVLFCCPLLHGFGMTEMGASFICNPGERVAGHIGGIQPSLEFCLRSVSELNYTVDGDEVCGELLVRGPSVTPGYLMNEEATNAALSKDGWLSSGDICVLLQGNCIKIIDRKKNIFKMAQGEYVAPERIEAIYTRASLIGQIFVHGEPTKSSLVGIVVPDEEMVARWAQQRDRPFGSLNEICQDEDFKAAVLHSMEEAALDGGLKGFEKVRHIRLDPHPFSVENNLLTPTLKLRRHEGRKQYAKEIDELYQEMNA